ncbi:heme o synthase [Pelagibacterium lentulum]|uniref:Protoheme IX farnesyltransferase n=1 Tax=Pelagibacterium lentulum TaxID=2029865 RepID=A0A916RJI0_9HYPH|nr:heme o synthase [Pelagibacterium lentulum]GGA56252.1 protoheme IX farnesyltransferase [Pelagibacterium lentulum]
MAYAENNSDTLETVSTGRVEDYFALLKPRVMSLVVFTGFVGLLVAPGGVHPVIGFVAILCIAIGAGASGALNMWYDADIDRVMSRTMNRPIPSGRIAPGEALGFGMTLSVFSVAILGLATNWLAAGLLAFTIFFYAVVYTMWLKRSTSQNIVIGGAAGAFPPMIGWAAVTGSVSLDALILFMIIFLWTPPHFWALALYKKGDYEAAGIPMLPNVAGERVTQNQIVIYTVLLTITGFGPVLTGLVGWFYAIPAAVLGVVFSVLAVRLRFSQGAEMKRRARVVFTYSLSYLFVLFVALLADVGLIRWFGGVS